MVSRDSTMIPGSELSRSRSHRTETPSHSAACSRVIGLSRSVGISFTTGFPFRNGRSPTPARGLASDARARRFFGWLRGSPFETEKPWRKWDLKIWGARVIFACCSYVLNAEFFIVTHAALQLEIRCLQYNNASAPYLAWSFEWKKVGFKEGRRPTRRRRALICG